MADESDGPGGEKENPGILRYLPLAVLVAVVGVVFATGLQKSVSFDNLINYQVTIRDMVAARPFATAGLYMLVYVGIVTLSIPASIFLSMTGGYLFGWALGGAMAAVASTVGAAGIFLIARTSVGELLSRRAGPRIQKLAAGFRADSFSYLLFLRLLPVMPFWITNLGAALFGTRFRTFLVATQIGVIPICYAFAVTGSGLDSLIRDQQRIRDLCLSAGRATCVAEFHPERLLTTELVVALALLGLLALAPIFVRRCRAVRRETQR